MQGTVPCSTCTKYADAITTRVPGMSAGKRWPRADGQKSPWHPLPFLHCELSRGRETGISVFSAKKRLCRLNRSTGPGAIASGHPGLAATASGRARKIGLTKSMTNYDNCHRRTMAKCSNREPQPTIPSTLLSQLPLLDM